MKQNDDIEYIPHLQLKIRLIIVLGIITTFLAIALFLSYHYAVRLLKDGIIRCTVLADLKSFFVQFSIEKYHLWSGK